MRSFTLFALIFHKIGFILLIFLTTGNKNPFNRLPIPATYCDYTEKPLRKDSKIYI